MSSFQFKNGQPDNGRVPFIEPGPSPKVRGCENMIMEKEYHLYDFEEPITKRKFSFKTFGAFLLAFAGVWVLSSWFLGGCLSSNWAEQEKKPDTKVNLVKHAVDAVRAPVATSPVLNVFQVYQPVLTPDGATTDTISSNGSQNTTAVGQVKSGSSCQLLLMDHSFGLSYGKPFVGEFHAIICAVPILINTQETTPHRRASSTELA